MARRLKEFIIGFHLRDGFYFDHDEDGNVTIIVTENAKYDSAILREITVPENEWASVVASVSKRGETYKTWQEAREFHGKT